MTKSDAEQVEPMKLIFNYNNVFYSFYYDDLGGCIHRSREYAINYVYTAVLRMEHFQGDAEVNITFTDDEKIREMNNQFRHIDAATDVLSFPLGENGEYDINPDTGCKQLGDIVISVERAKEQAKEYGHSLKREMAFLTAHSMLHLMGYDHMEEDERIVMEKKQEEILQNLGITRD